MKKVALAMSGGVDSSVSAYLLQKEGFSVSAAMLRLEKRSCYNRCCREETARLVCEKLGIPFSIIDATRAFKKAVIDYYQRESEAGRTPNPCIPCNQRVKFPLLFTFLRKRFPKGYLATGHYARTRRASDGRWQLLRAKNISKDQSYFLHRLTQEQLPRLIFPLGDFADKDQVRKIARQQGLPSATARESQDLCFQKPLITAKEGEIVNRRGEVLGRHKGLPFYTIGQRAGLGISAEKPLFVIKKEKETNKLVVGSKNDLLKKEFRLDRINLISGNYSPRTIKASVAVRYQAKEREGEIALFADRTGKARLKEPVSAPAPGQFAVFYQGDICLGGGAITEDALQPPPYPPLL